jgi:hypothetical protein
MKNQSESGVGTPEKQPNSGAFPVATGSALGLVNQRWWECTLDECPPGLFRHGDYYGFKTEYRDKNGPEAYVVESGEYFWGGTSDRDERRQLRVTPVIISPNSKAETRSGDQRGSPAR